jgi:MFS family permease
LAAVLFPAAAASLIAFIWWESREAQPIVRVALFRKAGFAVVNLAGCLMYLVTFAVMLIAPYFLVRYTGLSLPFAGAVLASGFVGMAATSPVAGMLVGRLGAGRIGPLGALASGAGLFLVGSWHPGTAPMAMMLTLALQGSGLALFQVAYMEIVMAALPLTDRGVAGSLSMLIRTLGVVLGAALLTLGFQALQNAAPSAASAGEATFLAAFHEIFRLCGVAAVLAGILVALSRWRGPGEERRA